MDEKLIQFIKKHVEIGSDMSKVKQALLSAGWEVKIIEAHIEHVLKSKRVKRELPKIISPLNIAIAVSIIIAIGLYFFSNIKIGGREVNKTENNAEETSKKDIKILNTAIINNDSSACEGISDINLKEQCLTRLEPPVYVNLTNTTCDANCQSIQLLNMALITNNNTLCFKIIEPSIKENCKQVFMKKGGAT